jgi:hypothetical protein
MNKPILRNQQWKNFFIAKESRLGGWRLAVGVVEHLVKQLSPCRHATELVLTASLSCALTAWSVLTLRLK